MPVSVSLSKKKKKKKKKVLSFVYGLWSEINALINTETQIPFAPDEVFLYALCLFHHVVKGHGVLDN